MPIFHIRTVTDGDDHACREPSGHPSVLVSADSDLGRVQYGDYLVFAPSLRAAFESVSDSPMVLGAVEVWGAVKVLQRDGVIVRPDVLLHAHTTWHDHWQWRASQDRYILLAEVASRSSDLACRHASQRHASVQSEVQVDGMPTP